MRSATGRLLLIPLLWQGSVLLLFHFCCPALGQVQTIDNDNFSGFHNVRNTGGTVEKVFLPVNEDGERQIQSTNFLRGLEEIGASIKQAVDNEKRFRAHGSRWALNDLNFENEYMLDPVNLAYLRIGLLDTDLDATVTGNGGELDRNTLAVVQAGVTVRELAAALEVEGLALQTSGNSDGQRFVGAVSTGTHGGRINFGGTTQSIRAIQIVVPADNGDGYVSKLVQPKQYFTPEFATFYGAEFMDPNEDLFNSLLVGVGTFGVIHSMVVQVEPLYALARYTARLRYSDAKEYITTLQNVQSLGIGDITVNRPFHVEATLNPYRLSGLNGFFFGGAYIVLMEQRDPTDALSSAQLRSNPIDDDNDIHRIMEQQLEGPFWSFLLSFVFWKSFLSDFVKQTVYPWFLASTLDTFANVGGLQPMIKLPKDMFTGSGSNPGNSLGISQTDFEIAVPLEVLAETIDIIVDILNDEPHSMAIGLRYVGKSSAYLASQRWETSVTITLPSFEDDFFFSGTAATYERIADVLAARNIEHSFHLGKQVPQNSEWLQRSSGADLQTWKDNRVELLGDYADMFCNDQATALGLCSDATS